MHVTYVYESCFLQMIINWFFILNRYHSRVLYVDIDIHHGDGVQVSAACHKL